MFGDSVYLRDPGGKNVACCVGIRTAFVVKDPSKDAYHVKLSKPYPWQFAVAHEWWGMDWEDCKSEEQKDYWNWCRHLEENLPITKVIKDGELYWQLPSCKYNQLVFIATLARHPLEHKGEYPMVYRAMCQGYYDPFGTIVSLTIDLNKKESIRNDWWYDPGPFYNSSGHGFGEIAQYLQGRGDYVPVSFHHLSMQKAFYDLADGSELPSRAFMSRRIGWLEQPRLYVVHDPQPPQMIPYVPKRKVKVRRKPRKVRHLTQPRDAYGKWIAWDVLVVE